MKKIIPIIFGMAISTTCSYAKEAIPVNTKMEAFTNKTGTVIIKGYTEVGGINGKYNESITVYAKDFTNPSSKTHSSGVTITLKESGRLEREANALE